MIFAIALKKNILVNEAYNSRVWAVDVSRNLQDWEVNEYEDLLQLLANVRLNNNSDKLIWDLKKNGKFSVNSFYKHLAGHNKNGSFIFPTKMVWKSKAPPCISFFAWEAVKEHILTIDSLIKRRKIIVNRCFLCKCDTETSNHILLWCPFTYSLWRLVYGLMGINWIMVGSVRNELLTWRDFVRIRAFIISFPWPSCGVLGKRDTLGLLKERKNFFSTLEIDSYIILVPWFWGMIFVVLVILESL